MENQRNKYNATKYLQCLFTSVRINFLFHSQWCHRHFLCCRYFSMVSAERKRERSIFHRTNQIKFINNFWRFGCCSIKNINVVQSILFEILVQFFGEDFIVILPEDYNLFWWDEWHNSKFFFLIFDLWILFHIDEELLLRNPFGSGVFVTLFNVWLQILKFNISILCEIKSYVMFH